LAQALFEGARERKPQERATYLANACPDDPELQNSILRMVDFDETDTTFLETPILAHVLTRPVLADGDLVDGRLRIVRLVAIGGMGEVYEAIDSETGEQVALKTVRRDLADIDEMGIRLRREIELVHRIAHPNVCKVHYFGADRQPDGEMLYLTMDFLDGKTLSDCLATRGPLPKAVALSIAGQIAAGLNAAHKENVIHQDLKPNNIMLVPRANGELRAVIMDFGIASSQEEEATIRPPGTRDYIPPERISQPGKVSTDIYSFGVILYEMVTGRRPFAPDTPAELRRKLPPAPSTLRRDLGRRWDRTILRCLDPSPDRRFANPIDVVTALETAPWSGPVVERLATGIAATIAAYLLITPVPSRGTLVIFPFESIGGSGSQGLMDYLADQLQKDPALRTKWLVFSPSEARQAKVTSAQQAKRSLGATHILSGTVTSEADSIIIAGQFVQIGNTRPLGTFQKTCPIDNTACLEGGVLKEIGGMLEPGSFNPAASLPISRQALPYYLQGAMYLHRDSVSYDTAIPLLQQSLALDPSAVPPRLALADAAIQEYREKGNPAKLAAAREILRQIPAAHADVPEVHAVAGNLYRWEGQYEAAIGELRIAVHADPSNHIYHRLLAIAYYLSAQDSDAIEEFDKTLTLQPRYWAGYIDYAVFKHRRGRFQESATLLERLIQLAPDHAQALATLGGVYVDMGRNGDAERVSRRSCELKPGALCYDNLGIALERQHRIDEALSALLRALSFGNPDEMLLFTIADLYDYLGKREKALEYFKRTEARIEQTLRTNLRSSGFRAILAYCLVQTGESERAMFELDQALHSYPKDKNVQKYAVLTYEALGQRAKTLEVLRSVHKDVLEDIERARGSQELRKDPKFAEIANEIRN
jgi:serine/threonine protein kinase/tetratricopeptide (TPR) repeat protein